MFWPWLNYCLLFKQRDTVVWAPEESPWERTRVSLLGNSATVMNGLVEGGPFSIGQDIAPIERVHASISWWSECIPSWRVWRFVKQPQLHKLHIEGKWNSWLSPWLPHASSRIPAVWRMSCNLFQHGLAKSACATDSRLNSTIGGYVCHSWTIEAFRNWSNGFVSQQSMATQSVRFG